MTNTKNTLACSSCISKKAHQKSQPFSMPCWKDRKTGLVHDTVPPELACLREGEKLLIQKAATCVPLLHLQHGQVGCKGHVCSCPLDVAEMCTVLPRLPNNVKLVKIVKTHKLDAGTVTGVTTFVTRRKVVLSALTWLRNNNPEHADTVIKEGNLSWMEDGLDEKELPCDNENCIEVTEEDDKIDNKSQQDRGPSDGQIASIEDETNDVDSSCGCLQNKFKDSPKAKDKDIVNDLDAATEIGKTKTKASISLNCLQF